VSKISDPEHVSNICVANVSDHDFISSMIDNQFKCNFIFINMPHLYKRVLILFMIMP